MKRSIVQRLHLSTLASSFLLLAGAVLLAGCENSQAGAEVLLKSEPAAGEVLQYPPRSVRLYFTALPDVERSELRLQGSNGEVELIHLHTMGADDLMAEVGQYPLPNGSYTLQWTATLTGGDKSYQGEYEFSVEAAQ